MCNCFLRIGSKPTQTGNPIIKIVISVINAGKFFAILIKRGCAYKNTSVKDFIIKIPIAVDIIIFKDWNLYTHCQYNKHCYSNSINTYFFVELLINYSPFLLIEIYNSSTSL